MVVCEITDIERLNDFVYYRQEFGATAVYKIMGEQKRGRIKFIIEDSALGHRNIGVKLVDNVDYPVLKVIMELKQLIQSLIDNDKLPLLK